MKTIILFLGKVLVKRIYIINAGFLLFLFFVFFGIVYAGQLIAYHRSLILSMITSPVLMAVVWLAWLLYNVKCILFCTAAIKDPDSNYIYTLKALSCSKQLLAYLVVSTLQYLPVLTYSFFVVYVAVSKAMWLTALLVAVYQLLMLALGSLVIFITISKNSITPVFEKLFAIVTKWNRIKLSYSGFLLGNIFYEKKIAFAIVKIFSILLLSVSFVRNSDNFDADLFGIFFQLIFAAHAVLVFYCVEFSETQMQFSRNLPVALHKVAGRYLFTYAIVLLPDVAFMLINNHGNLPVTDIILLYGIAIATLFLYTAMLYGCGLNMESYMLFVFIFFVMLFFLQKVGLPLLSMMAILLTATVVFETNYYSFERE